jgi:hypothetical protein
MRVLMWEAKGDADGLIAWWRGSVEPGLPEDASAQLFRSADRVVALLRFSGDRVRVPDPPEELCARPPHAWPFEAVD